MVYVRVRLVFYEEQDFLASNLITGDHVWKNQFSAEQNVPAWF
jgi:hypothetical protein